jgi:hypothetical protein
MLLKAPAVMEVHSGCYENNYWDSPVLEWQRSLHWSAGDFESSWDQSANLWETLRAAETAAQALQETLRHILTAVVFGVPEAQVVLATVPFCDCVYYSRSKRTRNWPVRFEVLPNCSLY